MNEHASADPQRNPQVAVIQDGARLHYAVPIALNRAGALHAMFSEWFLRPGLTARMLQASLGGFSSRRIRAMLQRRADQIPGRLVRTNYLLAARQHLASERHPTSESFYHWSSNAVGDWVRRTGLGDANILFGYVRNIDPQLCRYFRSRGIFTVADQIIAPAAIESAEEKIQHQRWPDWFIPRRRSDHELVQQIEQATWPELDLITCGSTYVRDGLIAQGVHAEKIEVIPYPIDATKYRPRQSSTSDQPITVGFLGTVGLRKGIPYFLEVAKRLRSPRLRFVIVGPVQLPASAIKLLGEFVEIIGPVPRAATIEWMQNFDLLLFPSTCEGNAGAVTEAMAAGIPIVTSPNSGTPVRDGIEGFIQDYFDVDGMAACVEQLASNAELRRSMGIASRTTAERLTLDHYGNQLLRRITAQLTEPSASLQRS